LGLEQAPKYFNNINAMAIKKSIPTAIPNPTAGLELVPSSG
jgi:hypothetical protein